MSKKILQPVDRWNRKQARAQCQNCKKYSRRTSSPPQTSRSQRVAAFHSRRRLYFTKSGKRELKPVDEYEIPKFLKAIEGSPYEDIFLVTLFTR